MATSTRSGTSYRGSNPRAQAAATTRGVRGSTEATGRKCSPRCARRSTTKTSRRRWPNDRADPALGYTVTSGQSCGSSNTSMPESFTNTPLLTERFDRALAYASEHHRRQLRKGTEIPYVSHLLAVTAIVLEMGGNEDEAIGALLHDVVEDAGPRAHRRAVRRRRGPHRRCQHGHRRATE